MPCMHIAFSHCFRWHFLFADKRANLQNKSHPDSISPIPFTIKQLVLQLAPIALWGNIPLHATGRRKIATTLQRVDGTYYGLSFILGQCFNLHLVKMMQNGQITQMLLYSPGQKADGLISVIASLVVGCHLQQAQGNMRKLA